MSGEFDKLIQNIEKLENTSFDSGLSIDKFLLPDKEAIKKYIAMLNPQMSPDDIDLMVDGAEELYKKIEEKIENRKKSKEEKERGLSASSGEATGGSQSGTSENPDSNEPSNPSDQAEKIRKEKEEKLKAEKEKRKEQIKEYVDLMKKIFPE
jgi:hypothetical protein